MSFFRNSRGIAIWDVQTVVNYSTGKSVEGLRSAVFMGRNVKRGEFSWSLLKSKTKGDHL